MNPAHVIVPALWLLWVAYWYAAARNAKVTQRKEDKRSRISHQLPLFVGALLMAIPFGGPLGGRFVPGTPLWQWIAIALIALGLGFSALARTWLAGNCDGQTGPRAYPQRPPTPSSATRSTPAS